MLLFFEIILKLNKKHNNTNIFLFLIINVISDIYLKIPKSLNVKDKFNCYDTIMYNCNLEKDGKDYFENIFFLSQKNYWVIYRFVNSIKYYK